MQHFSRIEASSSVIHIQPCYVEARNSCCILRLHAKNKIVQYRSSFIDAAVQDTEESNEQLELFHYPLTTLPESSHSFEFDDGSLLAGAQVHLFYG